jgi:hypothetical protein
MEVFEFDGWGLVILLSDFDGNQFIHEGKIRKRELIAAEDRFSIRFADSLFENEGNQSRVRFEVAGFRCDIMIDNILPPWIPGDGFAFLNEEKNIYMRKAIPAPLARTSGTMVVGGKTISAEGLCYCDRSLTVVPPWKMYFRSAAFRVFSEHSSGNESPWILALLHYTGIGEEKASEIPMLLLARGDEWIFTTKD